MRRYLEEEGVEEEEEEEVDGAGTEAASGSALGTAARLEESFFPLGGDTAVGLETSSVTLIMAQSSYVRS